LLANNAGALLARGSTAKEPGTGSGSDLVEGVSNSGRVLEILIFLRPELDRMVTGFRRSADMLVAMTVPLTDSR
jgi:hypothetical protein